MEFFSSIWDKIQSFFDSLFSGLEDLGTLQGAGLLYTAIARWVFIFLALFIVTKAIESLLKSRTPPEVFGYFNVKRGLIKHDQEVDDFDDLLDDTSLEPEYKYERSFPITHWENAVGRSKSCDLVVNDPAVSRSHGTLDRDDKGVWRFTDLESGNGTYINGKKIPKGRSAVVNPGDEIEIGDAVCTVYPVSLEERRNNMDMRKKETFLLSPWLSLVALSFFQAMTVVQLKFSLGDAWSDQIPIAFLALMITMWTYVLAMRSMRRKGFEMEILAFFLCTLSLSVTSSKFPEGVLKQYIAMLIGLILFVLMCAFLRNLDRSKAVKKYLYGLAVITLFLNLVLAKTVFGANNWIEIGGISVQPSEIVKLAFIWCGAASLDELLDRRSTLIFTLFSGLCFVCLALMNDFGTALIFFVVFLVISFLRSGDLTKIILIGGVAFVGGLLLLRFKAHVAARFSAWGHVWEFADSTGYQQTRTMSAAASGGLVGVGAGGGWLKYVAASETDLVFGFITEEWGLIIAILAVLAIITLSIFAFQSIMMGRSAFYTIAACSATALFLFQTTLNVFGSVDLFPLTGVTFPFLSTGGTSMVASWGMLAFLKAADTRLNASIAVANKKVREEVYEDEED